MRYHLPNLWMCPQRFCIFSHLFVVLIFTCCSLCSSSSYTHREPYTHCTAHGLSVVDLYLHSVCSLLTLCVCVYLQVSPLAMPFVYAMMVLKSMTVTVTLWPDPSPHMSSALERNVLHGTALTDLIYWLTDRFGKLKPGCEIPQTLAQFHFQMAKKLWFPCVRDQTSKYIRSGVMTPTGYVKLLC